MALVWSEELLHELERIVGKDEVTVLCRLEGQYNSIVCICG